MVIKTCEKNKIKNNRTLVVGPPYPGKTYLIMKKLNNSFNRDFFYRTRSPEQ